MNNSLLLTGLLAAALCGGGGHASAGNPRVVTLAEIFETAESNSVMLRPEKASETEASDGISVAKAGYLPDINASLSLSYIGDGFITKRDFSGYERAPIPHFGSGLSLNITQPVYTGGAVGTAVKMAELKSTAARYATDFRRDDIRFRLTGFYLDIYKCHNLRGVVERNIAQARQVLDEMRARYEQGVALSNDITRYELLLSNLELQLVKLDNSLEILNSNLVATAGLPEGTVVMPDTTMLGNALPDATEGWWQEEARLKSPALSLARTGVELSRRGEDMVRSELLPKIGIQAAWTIDGPILVEIPPINRNLSYWYVGVGVSYNLSSLYKSRRSLSRSRAATLVAKENLNVELQNVELAVRADYIRYLESHQELLTQEKSVELAERNYGVTSTRFAAGMALITDMLDAVNSKIDAEQQLVNARINIIYYYYKLLFTSGKI